MQPTSSLQQQQKAHLGVGEVVHHAARGAHNDVGPLAQGDGLCHHVHTAHQHCTLDADACPQGLKLLTDLNGQLARGGKHQAKQGLRLVQQGLQQAPPLQLLVCLQGLLLAGADQSMEASEGQTAA